MKSHVLGVRAPRAMHICIRFVCAFLWWPNCISRSVWQAIKIYGHNENDGRTTSNSIIIRFFFFNLIRHNDDEYCYYV